MNWKYGLASVAGTSHRKTSLPCQDASRAAVIDAGQDDEILIAVASDGAGSAAQARAGATLACDLLLEKVKSHFTSGGTWPSLNGDFIAASIEHFQHLVGCMAADAGIRVQDYACTLVAAVIGRDQAAYFQLGDGAMVTARRNEDDYHCVCWPQQGEYANTTSFLTDDEATEKVFVELRAGAIDELALFTDGIQSLVLDYRTRSAHAPFFEPLFEWLRPRPAGYSQDLSDALRAWLDSDRINARTDDDKTLILATRRPQ